MCRRHVPQKLKEIFVKIDLYQLQYPVRSPNSVVLRIFMASIAHRWNVPKRIIDWELVYGLDGRPWKCPVVKLKKGKSLTSLP